MLGEAYRGAMTTVTTYTVDELFESIVRDGFAPHERDISFVARMATNAGANEALVDAALDTDLEDVMRMRALARIASSTLAAQ